MDDQRDGSHARAPEFKEVIKVCESLNQAGVNYVLIGGFAVILHGFTRGTKDIDFLVDDSPANVKKIKEALSFLEDNAVSDLQDTDLQDYGVVRIADELVIDLLAKACGVSFAEAKGHIQIFEVEGIKIPVASKDLLIKTKDTVRPSDLADIAYLKALLSEEK